MLSKKIISWIPKDRYSRLTVINKTPTPLNQYKCQCECGRIAYRTKDELEWNIGTHSCSKQCNYRLKFQRARKARSPFVEQVYQVYQQNAKELQRKFEIPLELFKEMIYSPCYYCGAPFFGKLPNGRNKKRNGIDRVDNDRDYELDNIVTCCWSCNQFKSAHTFSIIKRYALIYEKMELFFKNNKLKLPE